VSDGGEDIVVDIDDDGARAFTPGVGDLAMDDSRVYIAADEILTVPVGDLAAPAIDVTATNGGATMIAVDTLHFFLSRRDASARADEPEPRHSLSLYLRSPKIAYAPAVVRHALLVLLAGSLVAACRAGSNGGQAGAEAAGEGSVETIDPNTYPTRLNPTGPGGKVLYMGDTEGCHLVSAGVDVPDLMAAINSTEPTGCGQMAHEAWKECRFGAVFANRDLSACICRATGKPAREMSCPN
jgi:hypothetical protein